MFYHKPEWERLRKLVLRRQFCEICGAHCVGKYNAHVDHIKPRKKFPELALNLNNLQLLCGHCHNSRKRKWENDDNKPMLNEDGTPSDPTHPWNTVA